MRKRRLQNSLDENKYNKKRVILKKTLPWAAVAAVTLALNAAARLSTDFAEWYATKIYPLLVGSIGRICSIFPFSVAEILLYLLIFGVIVEIFLVIARRRRLARSAADFAKTAIVLLLLFTLGCGINYHRLTFSEKAGFIVSDSDKSELRALCEFLVEEMNAYAEEISVDANGAFVLDVDVAEEAVLAMQALGSEYGDLAGYYPKAKSVIAWQLLSYQQLEGIYSPFTVEANYNKNAPAQDQPASVCHELSHLKGFMREDEANFIAYLACRASGSAAFNYSGTMTAYIYCINALYADDALSALEVREGLCEQALRDLSSHNAYWNAYDGAVSDAADTVNDAYLKANAQDDGTKSYGRMVDLMLSWYADYLEAGG